MRGTEVITLFELREYFPCLGINKAYPQLPPIKPARSIKNYKWFLLSWQITLNIIGNFSACACEMKIHSSWVLTICDGVIQNIWVWPAWRAAVCCFCLFSQDPSTHCKDKANITVSRVNFYFKTACCLHADTSRHTIQAVPGCKVASLYGHAKNTTDDNQLCSPAQHCSTNWLHKQISFIINEV